MRELGAVKTEIKAGREISQQPADVERDLSCLSVRPRSNYTDHWSILRFGSGLLWNSGMVCSFIDVWICTKSSNKIVINLIMAVG